MAITAYGTAIAWKSCRQTIRAESTCTAEYVAAADGLQWCSNFGHLEFFDTPAVSEGGIPKDLRLFMDSTAAIQVARSEEGKPKTRWLALRWHRVAEEKDRIHYIRSSDQKADILTKAPKSEGIKFLFTEFGTESLLSMKARRPFGISSKDVLMYKN